ncbi:uncharacterized protein BP5553_05051 [Venustampulla echinocandica]|uniref:Peptidase S1 domain-containing protein n=1 Tax=Venustampulla echinocandica TaxID=2656787 RepID=A0A370TQ29_9HELO|nr:uncharacterized protein BP5553_05051 [Venustampulla echinocandica]RDL37618.1 hypothetical protein BP5553_05051 [Venustampulla echinocandica]
MTDWAIVEVTNVSTFRLNRPPITEPMDPRQQSLPAGLKYRASKNHAISRVGIDLEKYSWVAKAGRSTSIFIDGYTAGHINCMKGRVHWDNGRDTLETVISNEPSGLQFAVRGDSGSMVISRNKDWVGLVISGESTGDTAYLMLAQAIIDDIKAKTGGTISLPL